MNKYLLMITATACIAGAAAGQSAGTVSQTDILSRVESHEDVQQALLGLSIRGAALSVETRWKGLDVSVIPSTKFDDAVAAMELTEASLGADIAIPLGVGGADRERKTQAQESYETARFQVAEALGSAYTELFSLYTASYLAQEAALLAEREESLSSLLLESTRLKVSRGLSSISDEADAEDAYRSASEKAIQADLDRRLSWLNLAYAAKMDSNASGTPPALSGEHLPSPGMGLADIPLFSPPLYGDLLKNVPQSGVLMAKAKAASASVQAQSQNLTAARRALESHSSLNLSFAPKVLYASPDVSASLGYSTSSGTVNLGSSWTTYERPAVTSGGAVPAQNTFTLSLAVSGSLGPQGSAEKDRLASAVLLEERKLQALEESLELTVRSRYASYLKAKDSLAASERSNALALEIAAATKSRTALGQTSPVDEAASEVLLLRSAYNVKKAAVDLARAFLSLIDSANAWDIAGIPLSVN